MSTADTDRPIAPGPRLGALVVGAALLAGCATLRGKVLHGVGPDYQRPSVSSPQEYRGTLGPPDAASLAELLPDSLCSPATSPARRLCTRVAKSSGVLGITFLSQRHVASIRNVGLKAPTPAEPRG